MACTFIEISAVLYANRQGAGCQSGVDWLGLPGQHREQLFETIGHDFNGDRRENQAE
jgi:hypothetical protein